MMKFLGFKLIPAPSQSNFAVYLRRILHPYGTESLHIKCQCSMFKIRISWYITANSTAFLPCFFRPTGSSSCTYTFVLPASLAPMYNVKICMYPTQLTQPRSQVHFNTQSGAEANTDAKRDTNYTRANTSESEVAVTAPAIEFNEQHPHPLDNSLRGALIEEAQGRQFVWGAVRAWHQRKQGEEFGKQQKRHEIRTTHGQTRASAQIIATATANNDTVGGFPTRLNDET